MPTDRSDELALGLAGPVPVMLARAQDDIPAEAALRGGCVYEPKWDGFRLVLVRNAKGARAWSRHGKELTSRFLDVVAAAESALPEGAVVDGEVVVWADGRLNFDLLQARLSTNVTAAKRTADGHPATFMAFDALSADGVDLRDLPWLERRAHLEQLGNWQPPLQLSPYTTSREEALTWFEDYRTAGVEGLVVKGALSVYRPEGRGWVKVKSRQTQEVIVGAVIGPLDSPKELVCGLRRDGRLVVVGRSAALSRAQSARLGELLREPQEPHPWPAQIGAGRFRSGKVSLTRVDPVLVVEVSADASLSGDRFRHPVRFVRHRPDLDPENVASLS